MINVPNHKKVTNAVPKNKECWVVVVKHLQFPGVGKIPKENLHTCAFWRVEKKKGVPLRPMSAAKEEELSSGNITWPTDTWFLEALLINPQNGDSYVLFPQQYNILI